MSELFLYNTLSRELEKFIPLKTDLVGLYTCGPTVYNFAHIGNLRTYLFEDILKRVLVYNGYTVQHVMNITDVGHLAGDTDNGEDKMEEGSKREGRSAWDLAEFYTAAFKKDLINLNIIEPTIWCKATDNVPEQIELIKTLETRGYTYLTPDGVYFDTAKFPEYNKLSHLNLDELREGARVAKNEAKRNATDFALWKFSPVGAKRQMEWESPWGVGFPGWHIECSAMSLKYLSPNLDLHCGGIDHINVHHTNEIAQSEAATGRPFFKYWLHGAFLNIAGGKKMAKSDGNFLTLDNAFIKKGINPLAYRYAILNVHYRKPMEYSEEIIKNAENGWDHLRHQVNDLGTEVGKIGKEYKYKFLETINNDLNLPQALAVASEMLKSKLSDADKLATVLDFDLVLGLELAEKIPAEIMALAEEREEARIAKDWSRSDELRQIIEDQGYLLKDGPNGFTLMKK
ncbi:cysteine--tRNA ligase [Candidatus Falkowbacteria bacterium CG_4_10_14_0_2_um_filter_41_15]|uniref:Cysteine--tRNA ligase n=3 Tax=Candidatus Falkowiibacteriota TaxID=1752728 RepID=A0A2G9ZMC1_9BACT|nr:MAG: cysteine--tRNA ligase [Candidatus Falkowbacteria bacterium CG23_combo_of_CG06-09_8_20_14_all_41_10]PIZ11417.1 MAG: cysteine--tRNA ligase [Candidatus Falkowbacteria bacterium CG_4_10_14_0_8_um_filter_41_36]PJA10331.1 MAG: cysteine--tRNA ligase [Candidatus Falkowbacteria bacterium CG_4_10_14_0_2_um_filter_41_15]